MIQSVQKPLPWWQQSAPPPMPGTEEDPTQPPAPPQQRFDMPDEPQQAQQQFMPEMPMWQQPQAMASAAPQGMPDMPGTTPAPAPAPAPIAPPKMDMQEDQAPPSSASGRPAPIARPYSVGPEPASPAPQVAPQAEDSRIAGDKEVMAAILKKSREHTPAWRQALAAALTFSPRTAGISKMVLNPPDKQEELAPLINQGAHQAVYEAQEKDNARLRQEQIEATKEMRLAAIEQRIAAQRGVVTPADRLAAINAHPEVKALLNEHELMQYVINGTVKESAGPTSVAPGHAVPDGKGGWTVPVTAPPQLRSVSPGGSLVDPAHPEKPVFTAPAKEVADKETTNQWIADSLNSDPEVSGPAKQKIAEWERTQKNQRPPVTINNNWTPQQAAAAQAPVEQGQRNEAFLKTLNPQDQVIIKMLADRDYALPKGRGALEKNTKYIAGAKAYDPTFNAGNYENEYALKKSAMSGPIAANMTSLNTALVHLGGLDQAASQLDNSTWKRYNTLANWLSRESGNPQTKPFQDYRTAFNAEMARALKGGVADKHEVDAWNSNIDMADSPAALKRAAQDVAHIIAGRIGQQEYQVKRGLGGKLPSNMLPFVSPEAQAVLDRLGSGQQQQSGPGAGKITVMDGHGKPHLFDTQEQANRFKELAHIK